ncbi:MAG: ATP-dependent RecD-like DNA helicase [Oscillospiraceae bacterium]|nr:ATP-dependent RecD-like DNA helicase [Candidatus Equicaccousia limihippi]
MENLKGVVEYITYQNRLNGYTVATVITDDGPVTVVGTLLSVAVGDTLELTGEMTEHSTYGTQFKVSDCKRVAPQGKAAILNYLSSGAIKGVGPATARLMVERFGEDTLEIIANSPLRLAEIRGISSEKAVKIGDEYAKQFSVRDIMFRFSKYGLSPQDAMTVYRALGDNAVEIFEKNPYVLCDEEIGFSFVKADQIAGLIQGARESDHRIGSGIIYILKHNLQNGHTCLPQDKLFAAAADLLETDGETLLKITDTLVASLRLRGKEIDGRRFLFLPDYYTAEEYCAANISARLAVPQSSIVAAKQEIEFVEKRLGIKYEELQQRAIEQVLTSGFLVLTGGPGTGKTTTLNAIINILNDKKLNVCLCAPTGRAAKRMSEVTGFAAKTIHRLLEVEWDKNDRPYFSKNERNKLDAQVLVVDEVSMVDIKLFEALLRATPINCKILLVGDADQLPSVGAGNLLQDIINFGKVPYITLKKIFRQAGQSLIVRNAHAILKGEEPQNGQSGSDFFMLTEHTAKDTADLVCDLVFSRLPGAYGFDRMKDIQILCPSRKGEMGCNNLNRILQDLLNPPAKTKKQMVYMGVTYREGDKVMQIKNNYDICYTADSGEEGSGVFNGDSGILEKIDHKNGMFFVRYDDRVATYYFENIKELELSYAVTVHKSQGSEYECVIIPLYDTPMPLLYRNLLYTAVTRAKKLLIVAGKTRQLYTMIQNDKKTLRYTALKAFLSENE